jgi:hypothetical protein
MNKFGVENSSFYELFSVLVVFCDKHRKVIVRGFFVFFGFINSNLVKKCQDSNMNKTIVTISIYNQKTISKKNGRTRTNMDCMVI